MACVIKLIYTKPEEEVWFSQFKEPLVINDVTTTPAMALKDFDKWNRDQPGYISSYGKPISINTVEIVYIFDTTENAVEWNSRRKEHPFQKAQDDYFSKINVSVVETVH